MKNDVTASRDHNDATLLISFFLKVEYIFCMKKYLQNDKKERECFNIKSVPVTSLATCNLDLLDLPDHQHQCHHYISFHNDL